MKLLSVAATAAALTLAPLAAHAFEFTLDLRGVDPNTERGRQLIRNWIDETAVNYCGPVNMPQPLELISVRSSCQVEAKAMARAAVEEALERNQDRVRWAPVVAAR